MNSGDKYMPTYTVNAPGFAPLQVQAVPELAEAVAAVSMGIDALPEGSVVSSLNAEQMAQGSETEQRA